VSDSSAYNRGSSAGQGDSGLSRLVQATQTAQVIYKAENGACRAFPDPQDEELARGPQRSFHLPAGRQGFSTRWTSWPSSPALEYRVPHSAAGRAPDSLLRLVLEQGSRDAAQAGRDHLLVHLLISTFSTPIGSWTIRAELGIYP
jgi:hypothetical protein